MANLESALARTADHKVEHTSWGKLVWMISGQLANSTTMTVGRCYIDPGAANPRHFHPNCDEVLHLLQGEIDHSLDDEIVRLTPGDTISIPEGAMHNATNASREPAIMLISFSTADRQTVGER